MGRITELTRLALSVLAVFACAAGGFAQEKMPLRWGTDPTGGAPFVFQNKAGEWTGFEWDFAAYLGEKLNRTPVMRPGDWDKLPQRLDRPADGDEGIDIVLNGYELREDLCKDYAVTRPYYVYRLQLVAHKDNDAITGWSDLPVRDKEKEKLKTVGVLGGSTAHEYALKKLGDRVDLQISTDVANVFGEVKKKRMDATVQDSTAATYFLGEEPDLKAVDEPRQPGFYVIYLRKSDDELRKQLDAAIESGIRDGTLKKMYQKYGLWNEDQERLYYWADPARKWPPFGTDEAVKSTDVNEVNPWPRMIGELLNAAKMTVFLAVTSFPLAMLLGLIIAIGRVYGPWWVGVPLGVYVEVVRGTPLLLQLYAVYYLLPTVLPPELTLTAVQAGILGLALNYAAYEAENYRAGLLAVPRGQMEAALSLGMTRLVAIRRVVVPQAARIVIPPVTNDFIALFKDTSVCSVILITELTRKYNELYNFNREYVAELAFVTAGLYLVMSYPLAIAARWLERRLSPNREGGRA